MEKTGNYRNLEDRLIEFAVLMMNITEHLPKSFAGKYIADQLVRSGSSPALNYAEAKSAESVNDFIHKMKICLKELRESYVALKIIKAKPMLPSDGNFEKALTECNELISIFVKSIQTAETNGKAK